jgi:hypothetical protein
MMKSVPAYAGFSHIYLRRVPTSPKRLRYSVGIRRPQEDRCTHICEALRRRPDRSFRRCRAALSQTAQERRDEILSWLSAWHANNKRGTNQHRPTRLYQGMNSRDWTASAHSQEVEDFRQCQPEPLRAYTFTGETLYQTRSSAVAPKMYSS